MDTYLIRKSTPSDKEAIIKLFFEFGNYLADLDNNALKLLIVPDNYGPEFYKRMVDDVEKKQGVIFTAEIEGKVIGFIAGVIIEVGGNPDEIDCTPHRLGRVTFLFISNEHRGQGLGRKLLVIITNYFRKKNCYKVNIEVFAPNQNAYGFYKKLGYIDRNYDVVKVL
jgi:ribosomal protein S18 acetylase RimI-like enzyme